MEKQTIKRLSVLSVVLIAASAVTAAIVPSKKSDDSKVLLNGQIEDSTGGNDKTCRLGSGDNCNYTATGENFGQSGTDAGDPTTNTLGDSHAGNNLGTTTGA